MGNKFIIDIEASGLASDSFPIEIALAALDSDLVWSSLISIPAAWEPDHWDEFAEEIHGITRERLRAGGKDVADVVRQISEVVGSGTVYTDAVEMDHFWLKRLWGEVWPQPAFPRVMPISELLAGYLDTLQLLESLPRQHRAASDAVQLRDFVLTSIGSKIGSAGMTNSN